MREFILADEVDWDRELEYITSLQDLESQPRISRRNVVGAIDGTHVPALVNKTKQTRYKNRKGWISQNVMAACSFDLQFQYVAAGWEGSAGDMKVLRWALHRGGFSVPEGKYYLIDSGYANTHQFVTPYRGNRYHLSEFENQRNKRYAGPNAAAEVIHVFRGGIWIADILCGSEDNLS
ncbi:hypothetical protein QJS10_CPA08g01325 [Acorus calamus]|uniref:DDE Tnp4 domain-containing protein n=1 Tax=Acorus calamus TaxID=4465 RepID=A0AAV9EAU9_ACOCL|nr:hypothetical protein QJS10_CPA08g01325 [Acorus calamus]